MKSDKQMPKIFDFWVTEIPKIESYKDFKEKYPEGSEGYSLFHSFGRYWEVLGALAYDGHISPELVLDALGGPAYNAKVNMIVEGIREETNNPVRYEHWQYLAEKSYAYWEKRKKSPRYEG